MVTEQAANLTEGVNIVIPMKLGFGNLKPGPFKAEEYDYGRNNPITLKEALALDIPQIAKPSKARRVPRTPPTSPQSGSAVLISPAPALERIGDVSSKPRQAEIASRKEAESLAVRRRVTELRAVEEALEEAIRSRAAETSAPPSPTNTQRFLGPEPTESRIVPSTKSQVKTEKQESEERSRWWERGGNSSDHERHFGGASVDYGNPKSDIRKVEDCHDNFDVTKADLGFPRTRNPDAAAWCNPQTEEDFEPVAEPYCSLRRGRAIRRRYLPYKLLRWGIGEPAQAPTQPVGGSHDGDNTPQDLVVAAHQPLGQLDQNIGLTGEDQPVPEASEDTTNSSTIKELKLGRPASSSGSERRYLEEVQWAKIRVSPKLNRQGNTRRVRAARLDLAPDRNRDGDQDAETSRHLLRASAPRPSFYHLRVDLVASGVKRANIAPHLFPIAASRPPSLARISQSAAERPMPKDGDDPTSPKSPVASFPPLPPPSEAGGRPQEFYGFVTWLCTYIAFGLIILWGILPDEWIVALGITWYPSREWALLIPSYGIFLCLLTWYTYWSLAIAATPEFDDLVTFTDSYALLPEKPGPNEDSPYKEILAHDAIPEVYDLPIGLVNRRLLGKRKRPKPSRLREPMPL
ncbi:hypothetical protein FRC01_003737 [Tulasnella sp. 417]|nr:hypothetical protein FRC01_003737 [Tulasnella sp. 417]